MSTVPQFLLDLSVEEIQEFEKKQNDTATASEEDDDGNEDGEAEAEWNNDDDDDVDDDQSSESVLSHSSDSDFIVDDEEVEDSKDSDSDVVEYTPSSKNRPKKKSNQRTQSAIKCSSSSSIPVKSCLTQQKAQVDYELIPRDRRPLAQSLYDSYNTSIFSSRLPSNLVIQWRTLRTTAGSCSFIQNSVDPAAIEGRYVKITLCPRMLDSLHKLQNTLCHEMCHAATWYLSGIMNPPHGKQFKYWGNLVTQHYPQIQITTCHSFDVYYKWRYQCERNECGKIIGRHTDSLDLSKWRCICGGSLLRLGQFARDGTPMKKRTQNVNPFAAFVQRQYNQVKAAQYPNLTHKEIMKILAQQWKEEKTKSSQHSAIQEKEEEEENTHNEENENTANNIPQIIDDDDDIIQKISFLNVDDSD